MALRERHHYRSRGPAVSRPDANAFFGVTTFGWWGMTETITHGIVGDPAHPGPYLCIGRPSPGYAIALRREDGSAAGSGERGALFVRGVRGDNVAASGIETVLPETGRMRECVVVQQEHYMLDEVPVAFVVPAPGAPLDLAARLTECCRARLRMSSAPVRSSAVGRRMPRAPRSSLSRCLRGTARRRSASALP